MIAPGEQSHTQLKTPVENQAAGRTIQPALKEPVQCRGRKIQPLAEKGNPQFGIGKVPPDQRHRVIDEPQIFTSLKLVARGISENFKRDRTLDPGMKRGVVVHHIIQPPEEFFRIGMAGDLMSGIAVRKQNRLGKRPTRQVVDKLLRDGRARLKDCKSQRTGKTYNASVLMTTEADGRAKFSLEFENGGAR